MRISDWSSDVCSSDLLLPAGPRRQSEDDRCDAYPRLFNDGPAARWTQARLLLQGSSKSRGLRAHLFLLVYDSRAGDRQQRWLFDQGTLRVTGLWDEFTDATGNTSGRERWCQHVEQSMVGGTRIKKKIINNKA